ncbi:Putative protein of unknown function [Podospora comata]|uniref:CorA-like transporter domain-containing protein n=1 Tax=Podospora comata TaxID=48703 RepID=A0ABY6SBK6_PODCO|nr:Putative protein of unknown function [Podospora comata]
MNLARNFGVKSSPKDEMHIALTMRNSWTQQNLSNPVEQEKTYVTEVCYNVRYFARNGRTEKAPWSERQVGIYHRLSERPTLSQWITIQMPEKIRSHFEDILTNRSSTDEDRLERHLSCHVVLFFGLARDWRDYLCFLESLLKISVSCLSRAFRKPKNTSTIY